MQRRIVVTELLLCAGATPGPIQGVQVGSRLVMCAWGSKGTKRGTIGWEPGMANFLYFSENCAPRLVSTCADMRMLHQTLASTSDLQVVTTARLVADGTNWTAAAPLEGQTFNECQVTALSNGSIVLVSRQAQTPLGQPHSYYITTCEASALPLRRGVSEFHVHS
jgi:hypothetical protein